MRQKRNSALSGQGAIYTLAQNGTAGNEQRPIILQGQGSDITVKGYSKRKGKTKVITQALVLKMIDIANKEGRKDIVKSLWNTYHCQNKMYTHEGRLYGKYCKNRFCTACIGIRKAEMINNYHPALKKWPDPYLVTLTIKAVPKKELKTMLKKCIEGLNRIIDKYEKRHNREKGKKLMGIRSLECNFNYTNRTYNPHMHLIVPDRETAEILKSEWLRLWTLKPTKRRWVSPDAQDIRKIENLDTALVEVIKYGTKVFTDQDGKKKPKGTVKMFARAFYNIILAMKGIRLFASFGFTLPKKEKDRNPARVVTDYQEWVYVPEYLDWIDQQTGNPLLDYHPTPELQDLLINHIDTESE